ncbi:MAG: PHP domain-containing protein [Burkholderiales bacterium]|nr:PHP domain-containing protein [Anaerolineae bacterium]
MTSSYEIVLEGHMPTGREKFYENVPFAMPPNVRRLDVRYDYSDKIGSDPHLTGGNTVDIGLFDHRGVDFLNAGFRGWTGSARSEFFITGTNATPGYLRGPLTAGRWYVCLGFYKVGPNGCDFRVTVRFTFGDEQTVEMPALLALDTPQKPYPASADGWYKGELHCHSVNSDGDSTAQDVIIQAQALGLDFLAITDHNNLTHLADLARLVGEGFPNLMLIPGCEVTTYRGHWNVWGLEEWVDFRIVSHNDMRRAINFAVERDYLTSCNHPRDYGPMWEYDDVEGYHCVEVWNGPWRLFNEQSLAFWEKRLREGKQLVAVGGSDMHRLKSAHHAHIATPTMWIYCSGEPSASGILAGLRAGHAFISDAPDGPQIYLSSGDAIMGDVLPYADAVDVQVRVVNGKATCLQLIDA